MQKYKEIFIFVLGSTPQILTETIYALSTGSSKIYPDEIIVITTTEGKRILQEVEKKQNVLKKLCEEYKIPYVEPQYRIPQDKKGEQLSDIRTTEDNQEMANLINEVVRSKASEKNTRLHCSIAGGRKTMSFYLGSALQLYGRAQDKLYHVLVSPEFETNKDFFYKPKKDIEIVTKDGKILNTRDAKIELAELPFLRIGEKAKITGESFNESIKHGQNAIDEAIFLQEVYVNLKTRELKIGDISVKLQPIHLALYATFLKLKIKCKKKQCGGCENCCITRKSWDIEAKKVFMEIYEKMRIAVPTWFSSDDRDSQKYQYNPEKFTSAISKINKSIKEALKNDSLAANYVILPKEKKYGGSRYTIKVSKNKIRFAG